MPSAKCPESILRLIDRFNKQADDIRSLDYNETQLRIDFVNPMFAALGWDIDNHQNFAEQYREVVHEDRVKVAGQTKAPDYSFRIGGQRKFFLEAKKPAVNIKENWEPAYQLRRYAWSAKLACSLLTDFEELAVYDTRIRPAALEKASIARREYIDYTQYESKWDFIHGTFSKDAVLRGEFDRYCDTKKGRGAELFDEAFLAEIEDWRKSLASNLALRNDSLDEPALNFSVQRIIDRILFLRIAEDRGTETIGQLQSLLNGDKVYDRLGKLFRDADARYNSGLFHFAIDRDRDEAPDTLTPALEIDDKTLKEIISALYYPKSPYEFTMVSADILGSVYERFLGKVITLTAGHRAKIEEKPEVRKAGGVYYTPTYIVDYIVKNTVGKLLDGKTPKEAAKIKVLDPACGSGSFLIGAYQFLLDWYLDQYTKEFEQSLRVPDDGDGKVWSEQQPKLGSAATTSHSTTSPRSMMLVAKSHLTSGKSAVLRPTPSGSWALTSSERKRILLTHIHGVDLDSQAVEVTKLNLLLKCLEGETSQTLGFEQRLFKERALPDLGKNILGGNSLIGTDIIGTEAWKQMSEEERARINPFDYARAFSKVFAGKDGGFDAVVGNPPYVRIQTTSGPESGFLSASYESAVGNYDTYCLFVERGLSVLRSSGRLSYIVPHRFFKTEYGTGLRAILSERKCVESVVDFDGFMVFEDASINTCIVCVAATQSKSLDYRRATFTKGDVTMVRDWLGADSQTELTAGPVAWSNLRQDPWIFVFGREEGLWKRLSLMPSTLGSVSDQVFQGLKTSADAVYIGTETGGDEKTALVQFGDDEKSVPIERSLVKHLVKGGEMRRYALQESRKRILFPYLSGEVIPEGRMRDEYPNAFAYLRSKREELLARESGQLKVPLWYAYGRSQAITTMSQPKIVTPEYYAHASFCWDCNGESFFCGGGAGGYAIVLKPGISHQAILACLNSRLCNWIISKTSVRAYQTAYMYVKKYIAPLPIPDLGSRKELKQVSALVDTMLSLHTRLSGEKLPQRREQLQREIDATDRQIDSLVYQLYGLTEAEIRIVEEATA